MLSGLFSFQGRTKRLPFVGWMIVYFIYVFLTSILLTLASAFLLKTLVSLLGGSLIVALIIIFASFFTSLALFLLPGLAITCRRLHDIGISGWWQALLPMMSVAMIVLFIFVLKGIDLGSAAALSDAENMSDAQRQQVLMSAIDPSKATHLMVMTIIYTGSQIIFGLILLFWPGTNGENKYDEYFGGTSQKNPAKFGPKQKFMIVLKEPVPEESMYVFKHMKNDNPAIIDINLPASRDRITLSAAVPPMSKSKIKKELHELGIITRSVNKVSHGL